MTPLEICTNANWVMPPPEGFKWRWRHTTRRLELYGHTGRKWVLFGWVTTMSKNTVYNHWVPMDSSGATLDAFIKFMFDPTTELLGAMTSLLQHLGFELTTEDSKQASNRAFSTGK